MTVLQVHQRVMHQPVNERVTGLLARRQEQAPGETVFPSSSPGDSAFIKEEEMMGPSVIGEPGGQEETRWQGSSIQEEQGGLEKGEVALKDEEQESVEGLTCRTCNKVRKAARILNLSSGGYLVTLWI